jgi:hypothetical protein
LYLDVASAFVFGNTLKIWLGLHDIEPREWHTMQNVKEWWSEVIHKNGQLKKVVHGIIYDV